MADWPLTSDHPATSGDLLMATAFAEVSRRLAAHTDVTEALRDLVDLTVQIVPGARWVSVTRGLDTRFTTLVATDQLAVDADLLQYRLGTGPCIDAVINESEFASPDLALDERWSHFGPQAARAFGTRSILSIRVTWNDDVDLNAGVNMYGDHIGAFDERSTTLARVLTTHAAVALAAVAQREATRHLQRALESNREIGVAMGVLMTRNRLTREGSFDLLRRASQSQNRKLHEIASDVADTGLPPDA